MGESGYLWFRPFLPMEITGFTCMAVAATARPVTHSLYRPHWLCPLANHETRHGSESLPQPQASTRSQRAATHRQCCSHTRSGLANLTETRDGLWRNDVIASALPWICLTSDPTYIPIDRTRIFQRTWPYLSPCSVTYGADFVVTLWKVSPNQPHRASTLSRVLKLSYWRLS
ncbi:hypothetical protein EI94DRAFT_393898 [Lactarius quietus]|nr:hypothetical protein EI94DRAFT_393898 [Lactarius quietus]